ncbi:MAG TPA: ATP-binding protein [Sphingomicrobium sp.]
MSRDPAWYRRNDDYLAAALVLLRHRLNTALSRPAVDPGRPKTSWWRDLVGRTDDSSGQAGAILLPGGEPGAALVEEKRLVDAVTEAGQGELTPALVSLARTFGLSAFEQDLLLMCLAVELDPQIANQMPAGGRPTFAMAMSVLPEPTWNAFAPDAPLRHWRLIEIERASAKPLTASGISVDERILNHAKGLDHLDARLAPLVRPVTVPEDAVPESRREGVAAVAAALDPAVPAVAVLRGPNRTSNEDVAAWASIARGVDLLRLGADGLPADPTELDGLARLWHREALLAPVALLVDAHEFESASGTDSVEARVSRFVARSGGGIVISTRDGVALPLTPLIDRLVDRSPAAEQLAGWQEALAGEQDARAAARRMVARFDLDRAGIAAVARAARADAADRPLVDRLQDAALARTRAALARLAERVEVKAGFADIVLPEVQAAQLRGIVDQLEHRVTVVEDWGFGAKMNRGLGISALFAGESGTGKTMAAEVISNALGLDLYRIDLSAVVSKYIGETEKNLARLFDAADHGGAVLLFDEADALFGKRSEVKDAHDRFANIEIDYLLQRMESYRGVAILTTNMKSAIDPAFMRRLRFVVDFPYPAAADRRRIWERSLPKDLPRGDIDLDRLARLDLSGAGIQSVALNAAFLAAARHSQVSSEILLEAGRAEFQKFGRPITEADFRLPLEPDRNAA